METMQSSLLSCDSPRAAGFILESGSGFRGGRVSSLSDLRCDSIVTCLSIHFRACESPFIYETREGGGATEKRETQGFFWLAFSPEWSHKWIPLIFAAMHV